ncbi:hypothetical protein L211DRAFT_232043 [Terfezia boudieri ATCC MYA-4762]|uniref:Uncharacterized protein n=1 Tax=Terfezia boudieri ATCC MYA-4762 TaxID=1051890 RepID=A0A3N4LKZ7_9PEZI|nr:hypothetical protein L211DRAFT_232043 [Terfezia boudieri ATCC MYA-4762]
MVHPDYAAQIAPSPPHQRHKEAATPRNHPNKPQPPNNRATQVRTQAVFLHPQPTTGTHDMTHFRSSIWLLSWDFFLLSLLARGFITLLAHLGPFPLARGIYWREVLPLARGFILVSTGELSFVSTGEWFCRPQSGLSGSSGI